jgi:hypothetical protein
MPIGEDIVHSCSLIVIAVTEPQFNIAFVHRLGQVGKAAVAIKYGGVQVVGKGRLLRLSMVPTAFPTGMVSWPPRL